MSRNQTKRKGGGKNRPKNNTVSIGTRSNYSQPRAVVGGNKMIVDNIRKKHHGLSRNAQAVLDQTLRLKTDGHLVIRPKARILIPPNTATSQYIAMGGSLAMANIPYTRGMPFEY